MSDFRVQQIDHVELVVPDQYEAAAWYERVLGLSIVRRFEGWAADGPLMVSSDSGSTMLALFRGTPQQAPREAAFRRVAFRVDGAGFAAFLVRLRELGLETERGAVLRAEDVVDHDGSLSIYFVDPWGHRLEVTTYETGAVEVPG